MLKPVVEQHHRAIELLLRESPGEVAIGTDEHRHAWTRARQHVRFVT